MSGGYLFGVFQGVALVSVALTLGAVAAMWVGRCLGRDWVQRRFVSHPRLAAIDQAVQSRAFLVVFLSRLCFALPYNLINYAYGLSGVAVGPYVLGTWFGLLSAVFLFVYLGSTARSIEALLRDGADIGPAGLVIVVLGAGLALGLVVLLNRAANRLLEGVEDKQG